MKVFVTEMPENPIDCLFSAYYDEYDVCECILSYDACDECKDVSKCPYLKILEEK